MKYVTTFTASILIALAGTTAAAQSSTTLGSGALPADDATQGSLLNSRTMTTPTTNPAFGAAASHPTVGTTTGTSTGTALGTSSNSATGLSGNTTTLGTSPVGTASGLPGASNFGTSAPLLPGTAAPAAPATGNLSH